MAPYLSRKTGAPSSAARAGADRPEREPGRERTFDADRNGSFAIHVECLGASAIAAHATAWADLCLRSLEPNVYLDPGFLLPLLQHAGAGRGLNVLLVWEENGPVTFGRLLGLFPIETSRGFPLDGVARALSHDQTSCGIPLVDRGRAGAVFEAALSWLAAHRPFVSALAFKGVGEHGPFHEALAGFCSASSRRLRVLDGHRRAVLRRREEGGIARVPSAKRRKEHARQVRRLAEAGVRAYASARTPERIATATDRFLALEHQGWKGARGTALLSDPGLAEFVRVMTGKMARDGRCRIDSLEVDGKPVAMGIILKTGAKSYFWKTAFDETYAALSPGVQFTIELTRAQLGDPACALTDSCAIADHPMIDKLWPDRMAVADLMLAVHPGGAARFAIVFNIERARRAARRRVKSLWLGLRRRAG